MNSASMLIIQDAKKRTFQDAMEGEGEEEEVRSPYSLFDLNVLSVLILP